MGCAPGSFRQRRVVLRLGVLLAGCPAFAGERAGKETQQCWQRRERKHCQARAKQTRGASTQGTLKSGFSVRMEDSCCPNLLCPLEMTE